MLGIFLSFKNYLLFPLTTESAQQYSSILRIIRDKIILRKKIQNIKKKKSLTTNNKSLQCRSGNPATARPHLCLPEHRSHFLMGMPITIKSSASVTSWRSNTDSACLFSSAMPSVSPSLAKAIGLYRWLK